MYLNNPEIGLYNKYLRTGAIDDLEEAIRIGQEAVDATAKDHPNLAMYLNNLGLGLRNRYFRTGAINNLEEAIRIERKAVDATSKDHPDLARRLNSLGLGLQNKYSRTKAINDLEEAIRISREAVDAISKDHPDLAGILNNLGIGLYNKYLRTGAIDDLEEAIRIGQEAVDATAKDHPNLAMYLNNLGLGLRNKYSRTGAINDLEKAICINREAVNATAKNHPDLAMYLNNLGLGLRNKYSRTGAINDLEEAICIGREAVNTISKDHPNLVGILHNLGTGLQDRYSRTGTIDDLEEAIRIGQKAIDAISKDHPDLVGILHNLGIGLRNRYSRTGAIDDLEEAIRIGRETVDATAKDHPDLAMYLNNLGHGLYSRYSRTGAIDDLKEANSSYQSALLQPTSNTMTRLNAYKGILQCCQKLSNWKQACEAADIAIPLIPRLTSRSIENSDKQHMLSQVVGMASDSAAVALLSGRDPLDALSFLEQGRGVLATSLEEIRIEILDLKEKHPELAEQFDSLREELDSPITRVTAFVDENYIPSGQDRTSKRYDANKRLDEVIENIRQQDGFEDFLLPPSKEEMLFAARFGSIVVINISEYRCDAILVEQHQIRLLNLPNLTKKEIEEKSVEILGTPKVLEWLWDVAVHPILEALGFTQPPSDDNWSHVWWIPTGPLSKFPLHAAGYHSTSPMESTLDRVISSYSSSIKAIIHTRQRPVVNNMPHTPVQALLVAMENTPGCSSLLFAEREIVALKSLCESMDLVPLEAEPRMESVKSHLPKCKIFHFAGHGETNLIDPSQSSLLLEDGRLTVATLLEMNLCKSSPFLAYLSACGTGRIQDERFLDESIHLISAYQLAGFRHVIGTLWDVNDESCVEITRTIYKVMRNKGMTDEAVCQGLHEAIRELRTCWLDRSLEKRRARKRRRLEKDKASLDCNQGTRNVSSKERDIKLPRSALEDDSDEEDDEKSRGPLHWVPYVHFGV